MLRNLVIVSLLLCGVGVLHAQGWERIYGASGQDEVYDVAPTPDGGYAIVGYYNAASAVNLIKTDADGRLQYRKTFPGNPMAAGFGIAVTLDGGYAIVGYIQNSPGGDRNIYLIKTDADGNQLWAEQYGGPNNDEGRDIIELPDGSLILTGYQTNFAGNREMAILKTDSDGTLLWSQKFSKPDSELEGNALALANNGNLVAAGRLRTTSPIKDDFFVVRLDDNTPLWENTFGLFDLFGNAGDEFAQDIVATDDDAFVLAGTTNIVQGGAGVLLKIDGDGSKNAIWQEVFPKTDFYGLTADGKNGFFVTGNKTLSPTSIDLVIVRTDSEGNPVCETVVGRAGLDIGYGITATPDGGALAVGSSNAFFPFSETQPYLVKMDPVCAVFTSYLNGNIFHDTNNNCTPNSGEKGLEDWIVRIEGSNFADRYAIADADGNFSVEVDTGTYTLRLFTPNNYWSACDSITTVHVANYYDSVEVNIPVSAVASCPRNEVNIGTPILRRCANNVYTVNYCNSGTIASVNTYVEVTLDDNMTFAGSSLPPVQQVGKTYTFNVGFLESGDCGSFTITGFLDCNTITGQAHCVDAHIFPDDFCDVNAAWDGSIVSARAVCDGDTVRLLLFNEGFGDMVSALDYVIAEDVVMLTAPNNPDFQFQLKQGQDSVLYETPANGKTYRIIAEQSLGYPGVSYPTAAVEGCVSDTSITGFSTGFYTMFPEDDADPFVSIDCQESNNADYNPTVFKRGHPKGYNTERYISPQTDLTYLIHFQNTGTDTVHSVVVRDTLSPYLDAATVIPGVSSHVYQFDVYGTGIVSFNLTNVNLAPGSSGYVKFRVSQKPELTCGIEILNTAAAYFDFHEPVLTNQTLHTVCPFDTFAIVQTKEVFIPGADVLVYPNPFAESTRISIRGVQAKSYTLEVYNMQSQLLFNDQQSQPTFQLWRRQLPAGTLFYRLVADGKPVASGKLLAH